MIPGFRSYRAFRQLRLIAALLALSCAAHAEPTVTASLSAYDYNFAGIAAGDSCWVAVGGRGQIRRSSDTTGASWFRVSGPVQSSLSDVSWTGRAFHAVSGSGDVIGSSDGRAWTVARKGQGVGLNQIERTSAGLVAVGVSGLVVHFDSSGGLWRDTTLDAEELFSLASSDSEMVVVGDSDRFYRSKDARTWMRDTLPARKPIIRVLWSGREHAFLFLALDGTLFALRDTGWTTYSSPDTTDSYNALVETPDGLLAAGSGAWYVRRGALPGALDFQQYYFVENYIIELAVRGSTVFASGFNGSVVRWSGSSFSRVKTFAPNYPLAYLSEVGGEQVFSPSGGDDPALVVIGKDSSWRAVPILDKPDTCIQTFKVVAAAAHDSTSLVVAQLDYNQNKTGATASIGERNKVFTGTYHPGDSSVRLVETGIVADMKPPVVVATDSGFVMLVKGRSYVSPDGSTWRDLGKIVLADSARSDSVTPYNVVWTGRWLYASFKLEPSGSIWTGTDWGIWRTNDLRTWHNTSIPSFYRDENLYAVPGMCYYVDAGSMAFAYDRILYSMGDVDSAWKSTGYWVPPQAISGGASIAFSWIGLSTLHATLDSGRTFPVVRTESGDSITTSALLAQIRAVPRTGTNGSILMYGFGDGSIFMGGYRVKRDPVTTSVGARLATSQRMRVAGASIRFDRPVSGEVRIEVLDLQGRLLGSSNVVLEQTADRVDLPRGLRTGAGCIVQVHVENAVFRAIAPPGAR